jgi:hypothetical protein
MPKRLGDKTAGGTNTGLLTAGDVGKLAGVPSNTVQKWSQRYPDFPKPKDKTTGGALYSKTAVMKWLRSTGRLKSGYKNEGKSK